MFVHSDNKTFKYVNFVSKHTGSGVYLITNVKQEDIELTPILKYIFDVIKKNRNSFKNIYLSHIKPIENNSIILNIVLDINKLTNEKNIIEKIMQTISEKLDSGINLAFIIYESLLKLNMDNVKENNQEYYEINDEYSLQITKTDEKLILSISSKTINDKNTKIFSYLVSKINKQYSKYLLEEAYTIITMIFKLTNDCYMVIISNKHVDIKNFYKEIYPKLRKYSIK